MQTIIIKPLPFKMCMELEPGTRGAVHSDSRGTAWFGREYQKRHVAALAGRERQRRLVRNESTKTNAVCANTTSRGLQPR
jgi:hypothetical protein